MNDLIQWIIQNTVAGKIDKQVAAELIQKIQSIPTAESQMPKTENTNSIQRSAISALPEADYYPTSSGQKRLYFLQELKADAISYNMPGALRIKGRLDRYDFEKVFHKLIARHEALRTSFELVEGDVIQRIHKEVEFEIGYQKAIESEITGIINQFIRSFNLRQAPLLRAQLLEFSPDDHLLLFDLHHIIADGASITILVKDFIDFMKGRELPELRVQYKDVAVWQNQQQKTEQYRKQKEYWLTELKDEIPVMQWPSDFPRPAFQSFAGKKVVIGCTPELLNNLKKLANDTGSTLFMTLMAIYHVLLFKYTGQEDMIVGTGIAGRNHDEVEGVIGMFVNSLPIRSRPGGTKTFRQLLDEVKQKLLQAYANQDCQFDHLVEQLNIPRDPSRNPVFDTALVYQDLRDLYFEISGLSFSFCELESNVSKLDLTLYIKDSQTDIVLEFEYCSDLFAKETIQEMANRYLKIGKIVTENVNIRLNEIEMMDAGMKEKVLNQIRENQNKLVLDVDF